MDNSVVISTPPHVKSRRTTKGIMLDVIIALIPAAVMGIVYFGWGAVIPIITSVFGAVATEFVYFFIANKGFSGKCRHAKEVCKKWWRQFDYTSIVTGLILALIIPPLPKNELYRFYEVLIGSIFAIAIVKMVFGGTGKNLVNPAAAARVFMLLSFMASMNAYIATNIDPISLDSNLFTGATHLGGYLLNGKAAGQINWLDLFLGTGVAGCIGETCKLALIVGYIYLCVRKVIKWWQPLIYIVVSSFLSVCLAATGGSFQIGLFLDFALSGGLMFGAIFMATDYVTSPKGVYGQLVYYLALAVLTSLLRYLTKIEVVSFVIMFMNLLVPLIDTYIVRRPFGYKKVKKEKKAKEGK